MNDYYSEIGLLSAVMAHAMVQPVIGQASQSEYYFKVRSIVSHNGPCICGDSKNLLQWKMSKIIDLMYFVLGMWWRKVTHWLALLSGTLSIMEGKGELVLSVPLQVQHYDPGSEASQQALDQRGPLAWQISQNSPH